MTWPNSKQYIAEWNRISWGVKRTNTRKVLYVNQSHVQEKDENCVGARTEKKKHLGRVSNAVVCTSEHTPICQAQLTIVAEKLNQ